MNRPRVVAVVILLAAWCASAGARTDAPLSRAQQETLLREGQEAFAAGLADRTDDPAEARGAFLRAADRWSVLVDHGIVNGPLLYDLGNAFVQSGELGRGIATYLRAQRYIPGDARLSENLAHARTLVATQFAPDTSEAMLARLAFWHTHWPLSTRILIFGTAWCVLWGVLLVGRYRSIQGWKWMALPAGVLAVVFGASAALAMIGSDRAGVVVQDDVIVRKGDAATYAPRFEEPIHRGVEFRIIEERPTWLHVEFPDGQEGWLPRDAAEVVLDNSSATAQT